VSQESVDLVRRVNDAILRRDEEAFVEGCRPDVQWEENTSVYPGLRPVYVGHAGARQWFSEITDVWSEMRVERAGYLDVGDDCVLGDVTFTARGKASGIETTLRVWFVVWLVDGKIARRQLFSDEEAARRVARLKG
jgi:ketosteroid isomerase-like protein